MSDDPMGMKALSEVGGELAKQAQDFIAAVTGHKGESIGTIFGDMVRERRENAKTVIEKAGLIQLNIGFKTRKVPLNISQPLIEGASLQEEEYLRDTWANLLANSADGRKADSVLPIFPAMLKELTSREVRFLHELFGEVKGIIHTRLNVESLMNVYERCTNPSQDPAVKIDNQEFYLILEILERNRILSEHLTRESVAPIQPRVGISAGDNTGLQDLRGYYKFTQLGYAFVAACQPPR